MPSFAGAVILPGTKKTLLFKNKDLDSKSFQDEIVYNNSYFGIRGNDRTTGVIDGLSIGVNMQGLAIANTHVRSTSDISYLILTEQLLKHGKDAEDGLGITVDQLKSGSSYQWGNLILADLDSMLVIELAGTDHSMEWSERRALRTSHHIMLDTESTLREEGADYDSSVKRVERGYDLVRNASTIQDVFSLLKDHGEGKGRSSLCRHPEMSDGISTVMSYMIEIDYHSNTERPAIMFHVAKGNPCEASFATIPIAFPANEYAVNNARQMFQKA